MIFFNFSFRKPKIVCEYRRDPVPYVSYSRNMYSYFRKPKTFPEKRDFYKYGVEFVRGARRPTSLPDPWDDYLISKHQDRGWKRTKKRKQWM